MAQARIPSILPSSVPSYLGPLKVALEPDLMADGAVGETEFVNRTIKVQAELPPVTLWSTFWHEIAHVVLWDSGSHNHMSKETIEQVCDAFGTWMTMAMQKGFVTVASPKETK